MGSKFNDLFHSPSKLGTNLKDRGRQNTMAAEPHSLIRCNLFLSLLHRLSNATFYTEEEASNQTCKEYGNCSIDWQLAVGKSLSPLAYSAIDVDELTLWSTVVGDDTIRQASKDIRGMKSTVLV